MSQSLRISTSLLALFACQTFAGCSSVGAGTSAVEGEAVTSTCGTDQIFGNAQHSGRTCEEISDLAVIGSVTMDPDARTLNDDFGFLAVHYGSPLSSGSWVYVQTKEGYSGPSRKHTQTWGVSAYRWAGAELTPVWKHLSRWKPVDALNPFGTTNGYESLYQAALANGALYAPDSSGQVARLDPATGEVITVINPLAGTPYSGDPSTIVNSALTVDSLGRVYYTIVAWDPSGDISISPRESWLVRVSADNTSLALPWSQIATREVGIPQGNDGCTYPFSFANPVPRRPWPPTPDARPPVHPCGTSRPPVNAAPVLTAAGDVIVLTSQNNAISHAHLLAVSMDRGVPLWSTTTSERIADGCGVLIPVGPAASNCRVGARLGIDPILNELVSGRLPSIEEIAPVVAPDGSIYIATYSGAYDGNQGHLLRLDGRGRLLDVHDYAWEVTPFIYQHDGSFTIVADNNHFREGQFFTARFTPALELINETRVEQRRNVLGNDFLNGQPAVDVAGNVYALNAHGAIYKISPSGEVLESVELGVDMETLSQEPSWGHDAEGRPVLYMPHAGELFAVGSAAGHNVTQFAPAQRLGARPALNAKLNRDALVAPPGVDLARRAR